MIRPSPNGDLFRLSAELAPYPYGYQPTDALFDSGTGRIPLTRSANATLRRYQAREPNATIAGEGIGTLYIGTNADYLRGPYRARIAALRGYGNAISSEDFFIGGYVQVPSSVSAGEYYFATVRDSTPTAAGTAWAFGISTAYTLFFEFSDGTTIRRLSSLTVGNFTSAGRYYVGVERYKGVLYLYCCQITSSGEITTRRAMATLVARARFPGSINVPTSEEISFGAPKVGATFSLGYMMDQWCIRSSFLYGGVTSFPVPDRPFGLTRTGMADTTIAAPAVQLRFEDDPGFLVDEGSAGSTWTSSNGVQSTSGPKEGVKCVTFAGQTQATYYLDTVATIDNCMNGSGDCAMGGWFLPFSGLAGTSGYLCGVREGDASAPNTGAFFYRGGGSDSFFFFWSDGTTINNFDTGVVGTTGVERHLWAEQYTTGGTKKIFIYVDGALQNSGGTAFSGSIPIPSGGRLRVGSLAYTVGGGATNMCASADLFQVYQSSLYKGASSFTPPVLGR